MAEELKTVLGFEASQAISTLAAMEVQLAKYTSTLFVSADAVQKWNVVAGRTDAKLKQLEGATRGVTGAQQRIREGTKKTTAEVQRQEQAVEDVAEQTKKSSRQMVLSWQSVIRIFAIQVIHQLISRVTSSLYEGVEAARRYEISLAEIQTIGVEFRGNIERLGESMRRLSDTFGEQIETIAEAEYQTLSNQVARTGESIEFLTSSLNFAIAAVTSADASVNLLSSTLNSYNLTVSQTDEVAGKLFKTIELGRIRGEEFASTFGRVTVLSAQLGVSLDEVLASIATLTVSGLRYNEAFTLLTNIQLKLVRPTDNLKDRFKAMGVATAEAGIQAYGFQGFLEQIAKESGESATEIGKLFNRIRAVRGVLGLTNEAAERYERNLQAIREAGAEELFVARDIIFETNAKQVEIELTRLRNVFVDDLGRGINKVMLMTMNLFGGAVNAIRVFTITLVAASAAFVTFKLAGTASFAAIYLKIKATIIAVGGLRVALMSLVTTPIGLILTLGTVIAGLYFIFGRVEKQARETFARIKTEAEAAIDSIVKQQELLNKTNKRITDEIFARTQRYLIERTRTYTETIRREERLEEMMSASLRRQLDDRASAVYAFVNAVAETGERAREKMKELNEEIVGVRQEIAAFRFERALRGLDPLTEAFRRIERSQQLRRAATEAINKGDLESAKIFADQARSQAEAALSAADRSKKGSWIRKTENEVVLAMETQHSIRSAAIKQEENQVKLAGEQTNKLMQHVELLRVLIDEYGVLEERLKKVKWTPEAEQVKKDIKAVAARIQTEFNYFGQQAGLATSLGLEDEFRKSAKRVRDIMSKEITDFEIIVNINTERLEAGFQRIIETADPVMKKLAEMGLVAAPAEMQSRLVEMKDNLKAARQEVVRLAEGEEDITAAIKRVPEYVRILQDELEIVEHKQERWNKKVERAAHLYPQAEKYQKILHENARALETLIALSETASQLLEEPILRVDEFNSIIKATKYHITDLRERGFDVAADSLQELVQLFEKRAIAQQGPAYKEAAEKLAEYETKVRTLETALNQAEATNKNMADQAIRLGDATITGVDTSKPAIDRYNGWIKDSIGLLKERNRLAAMGGGEAAGRRFGGLMYRASGGFVPRGTDVIPAMLSPGEFVVNASSARRFFSQLEAINAGAKPIYRQEGGPVTSIGDINITVNEAVTPEQTARATIAKFRREFRRKTSVLN